MSTSPVGSSETKLNGSKEKANGAAGAARSQNRLREINDTVIRIAGNSQDGIQAVGGFLARLAGRSDQDVMTYMTIPSTISGGPSIFQVRMGTGDILSAGDEADFLVAFYQHSYQEHIGFLKKGGVLLYDSDHVQPDTTNKDYVYVGVPMTSLTVEAIGGTARDKGKNIFLLGLLAKVFDLDTEKLEKLIRERFSSKDESIANTALTAFHAGYAFPVGNIIELYRFAHKEAHTGRPHVTMDGNQALAYGLLAGGVRYGAGYPITPWSSVMEILRAELIKYGGLFVQCEDELGAVSMAIGFAYAGHTAITGSAGPGISLKTEAIGWASMAEVPLIVVNVQRGGPSTGLPTNVEQSDLYQAIFGGHGDSPRVVLAPYSVEDCFYVAIDAAKIARKYSTPVFILSDTSLATRIEAFEEPDLKAIMVPPQVNLTPPQGEFKPYPLDKITQHAAPGTPMPAGKYPLVTGLEHDEMGHPSGSPKLHMAMTAKRREKYKLLAKELPTPKVYGKEKGEVLLVGWGSTYGPIREAVDKANAEGQSFSSVHIRSLHPLPEGLEKIFDGYKHILVVEMNDEGFYGYGQLATVLRARYCNPAIASITKTDGLTWKVREIIDRCLSHLKNGGKKSA
jgi:2-oxoglutarate ferredoxin oxidoreductase subunit alpha